MNKLICIFVNGNMCKSDIYGGGWLRKEVHNAFGLPWKKQWSASCPFSGRDVFSRVNLFVFKEICKGENSFFGSFPPFSVFVCPFLSTLKLNDV